MKKLSILICIAFLLSACATYKSLDLNQLTFGMTTEQVIRVAGKPNRVLAARQTNEGYQEVLEFRTGYGEIYALEFWNDYLTGYEYLQDEVIYVAPVHPPMSFPQYGRPVYIINNRPTQPNRSSQPSRSTSGRTAPRSGSVQPSTPSQTGRSDSGKTEPTGRSSRKNDGSTNSNRSGQPASTSRSEQSQTPSRSTQTRSTEVPSRSETSGSNTRRESSRSTNTREDSSSGRTQ